MCPTEIATAKPQPTNDSVQLEPKSAALVAAVFVDFPKNKRKSSRCNKKNVAETNSSQGGAL